MARLPFPLPPLAEQQRIVAKFDELLGLCNRLEAEQRERDAHRNRVAVSALQRLKVAARTNGLQESASFYLGHLSELCVSRDQIASIRQTILYLAVLGKLVPQTTEVPAAAAILNEASEVRKPTNTRSKLSAIDDADPKFSEHLPESLPQRWTASPMEDLCTFIDYRGKTPARTSAGIRLITAKNVRMGRVANDPVEYIDESTYKKWMTRGFPQKGDVLFVTEGATMGYVGLIDFDFTFALAQRTINLRPHSPAYSRFLLFVIMSPIFQQAIGTNSTGTAVKGIKASRLKRIRVPVPPPVELQRIVEKVDQLMAICDRLEEQLVKISTYRDRLLETVLHHALN